MEDQHNSCLNVVGVPPTPNTYHMIMMTSFITISLRMLKNSIINLARSPILPMQMPNAIKKPIRPVRKSHTIVRVWQWKWTGGGIEIRQNRFMTVRLCNVIQTQDIHSTLELQGLFNDKLRFLGNICQQALHSSGIDIFLNNHLHLLSHRLDLKWKSNVHW